MNNVSTQNNVQNNLNYSYLEAKKTQKEEEDASKKIANGNKNDDAKSDPSNLAVSVALIAQMQGSSQASKNAQDGISLLQTADGGLSSTNDMLQRARELTVQAGNGIYSDSQRDIMNQELNQISEGIKDVSENTQFNGQNLLDGSNNELTLQTGANAGDQTILDLSGSDISDLNTVDGFDLNTMSTDDILNAIDEDLDSVSSGRAELGASSNTLSSTVNSLTETSVNMAAANSQISDTDMAKELVEENRANVVRAAQVNMLMQNTNNMTNAMNILAN